MNPRVIKIKILENHKLLVSFSNNENKVFDVTPYLSIGIFRDLRNSEIFNSAKVVDGTVKWCNEADFCPDTLYLESIAV